MVQIAQSGLKRIARGQGEGECKQACNVDIMEATQSTLISRKPHNQR